MTRLILALSVLFGLAFAQPVAAQERDISKLSNQEIIASAPKLHPAALYVLAARLLAEGRGQEAANWMYAGQLRYRILIAVTKQNPDSSGRKLFDALTEQVGRPINEHIAGKPDEWIAAIDWALKWDAGNPDGLIDRTAYASTVKEVRAGLLTLRDNVDTRREEIARERMKNGLQNR
ncbi:hypothetical protein [Terrihabitans sp. B22-R8]|uniref:hypothetical protein n=1 Tax=Terrihabitans sp. B22-R8 TaxID=3425128 RepID=UPI00403C6464